MSELLTIIAGVVTGLIIRGLYLGRCWRLEVLRLRSLAAWQQDRIRVLEGTESTDRSRP